MTAMMFLQLRDLTRRGVRIARQRASPVFSQFGG
jgi:DNA polymerase-3 subunit epsilon